MLAGVEWGDKWMDKPVKVSYIVIRKKFCPKIEAAYDVGFAGFSERGCVCDGSCSATSTEVF